MKSNGYSLIYIEASLREKNENDYIHHKIKLRSVKFNHQNTIGDIVKKLKESLHEKYHQACNEWLKLNEEVEDVNVIEVFGKELSYANFSIIDNN